MYKLWIGRKIRLKKLRAHTLSNIGKKSTSFFHKLVLLTSILVIVIIVLVSLVMNSVFTKHLEDKIHDSNKKILSQISYNFKYMDTFVRRFILNTFEDNKTKVLLYSKEDDILNLLEGIEYLDTNRNNSPFIQSYYLYNSETENFFCLGTANVLRKKDEMYDREIVEILENITPYNTLKPIARTIPVSPYQVDNKINVYTYILCNFDMKTDALKEAIVVNVDSDWIFDNIKSMSDEHLGQESIFMMVDRNGTVLGHTFDNMYLTNLSKEAYIERIISSQSPTGVFKQEIDEDIYYITYSTLKQSDVLFISMSLEKSLDENFHVMKQLLIIISVIILVIGLCASFIMSKVLYAPIRILKNYVKLSFTASKLSSDTSQDEFQLIQNVLTEMKTDIVSLNEFRDKNIEKIKHQYIMQLTTNPPKDIDTMQKQIDQYGMNIHLDKKMILLLCNIDHHQIIKLNPENDIKLIYTAIEHDIDSLLTAEYESVTIEKDGSFISFINIEYDSLSNDAITKRLINSLNGIQDVISQEYKISLTMTISPIINSAKNIAQSYKNLVTMSKYRLILGHGSIITPELINDMAADTFHLPVKQANKLKDAIKQEDEKQAERICKKIIYYLSQHTIQDIRFGLSYISLSIIDTVNTIANNGSISFDIDFIAFNNQINDMETLDEATAYYTETIKFIIHKMKESKNSKAEHIIDDTEEFIENNLTDINLSVNMIAESIGLTSKYLNVLYKKHTGNSIGSVINNLRMDKARQMILETNQSIDSIIEQIGWGSKKYFFTCFKKRFGVTPSVYRNNNA
jgi:YesN/AraC family two-component response regulator